jgi:small multidrug resistance pump
MHWLFLIAAIVLEVGGTTSMKLSAGFTRLGPSLAMFVLYGASLASLTMALKIIDVSVAYAVWSGLGTALIAAIGMAWFGEPVSLAKLSFIALIIIGVAGLNLFGQARAQPELAPSVAINSSMTEPVARP